MIKKEFQLDRPCGPLVCTLLEPRSDRLAGAPALLLAIAGDRGSALWGPIHRIPTDLFLAAGHRVLAFDLPHHGDRAGGPHGADLAGMRRALLAGEDPFERFVADALAAIDASWERGWVGPGRLVAAGASRGGYCALRLLAADPRVVAAAAMAPVTDWALLREFADHHADPRVSSTRLERWVEPLADRPVFVAIGANDDRVGTHLCARFMASLLEARAKRGAAMGCVSFHVDPRSQGHGLAACWYERAAHFLIDAVANPPRHDTERTRGTGNGT